MHRGDETCASHKAVLLTLCEIYGVEHGCNMIRWLQNFLTDIYWFGKFYDLEKCFAEVASEQVSGPGDSSADADVAGHIFLLSSCFASSIVN